MDFNGKSRKKVMETFSRAVEPGSNVRNQIEEARTGLYNELPQV
jgi:hypothetical protein